MAGAASKPVSSKPPVNLSLSANGSPGAISDSSLPTGANVHDLDQITHLVRADDQVVYADAGYQGVDKRPDISSDDHLSQIQWRVAARKGVLKTLPACDRVIESGEASVRAKVEHVFLVLKRDFGFTKTRYRGLPKNLHHLHVAMASANLLMRARAITIEARLNAVVSTG